MAISSLLPGKEVTGTATMAATVVAFRFLEGQGKGGPREIMEGVLKLLGGFLDKVGAGRCNFEVGTENTAQAGQSTCRLLMLEKPELVEVSPCTQAHRAEATQGRSVFRLAPLPMAAAAASRCTLEQGTQEKEATSLSSQETLAEKSAGTFRFVLGTRSGQAVAH